MLALTVASTELYVDPYTIRVSFTLDKPVFAGTLEFYSTWTGKATYPLSDFMTMPLSPGRHTYTKTNLWPTPIWDLRIRAFNVTGEELLSASWPT